MQAYPPPHAQVPSLSYKALGAPTLLYLPGQLVVIWKVVDDLPRLEPDAVLREENLLHLVEDTGSSFENPSVAIKDNRRSATSPIREKPVPNGN